MRKAILNKFLIVAITVLSVMALLFCVCVSEVMVRQIQSDMISSLNLVEYHLDYKHDLKEQISNINTVVLTDDTRLTVIENDGDVITDTNVDGDKLENHSDREEVIEALQTGMGKSKRYSETLDQTMIYVSVLSINGDYVLRLSMPYYGFMHYLDDFLPSILMSFGVAMLLAFIISRKMSKQISTPLAHISKEILKIQGKNHNLNFKKYEWEELDTIVQSTMRLSGNINNTISKLEYERNRINYILDNMKEGFILLDENQEVLVMNQSSRDFLNSQEMDIGKHIVHYTHNTKLLDAISEVDKNNEGKSMDISFLDDVTISVHIAKVEKNILNNNSGIILLMLDVTNERDAVKMRQEFFSNASHELKTPITSIQGYAELLESGIIVDEKQKQEFLGRIKKEAKNMTVLINDILTISKIENKQILQSTEFFNVKDIVLDIKKTLEPLANKANISIEVEADDVTITSNRSQFNQLINNLMTNAVIYNRENGMVRVILRKENDNIFLVVEDNGIGITAEAQSRIFERFYRVDKGRSKKLGGTGLGLAIVKHIVQFYKGTINLESKIDVGTRITVILPVLDK